MTRARYRNGPPPTLEQYRELDRQGRIRRPLTDPPIGADPTRRHLDAIASDAVTEVLGVTPVSWPTRRPQRKDVA